MAKDKEAVANPMLRELFQMGVYKRSQGRITRQVTFASMAVLIAIAAWRFSAFSINSTPGVRYGVPAAMLLIGLWLSYRAVNIPKFADFLIAVEAEMNKVSWPTRAELFRASIVVMVMILSLAAVLAIYDLIWKWLLHGLLRI